jgi:putative tryptophan/tyrosine transport system substrate-binding protein
VKVSEPNDLENAFSTMIKGRANGLIPLAGANFTYRGQIADLAAKSRLPAIYPGGEFVDAGGLMSYGPDITENFRRAATYVDKILKGTKPGDLPVQQPTKFELIINLKAAKQIGLTIPPNILARADRVVK